MHRWFLITASLIGALSVALGAFAAHRLKQIVPADVVATFETGVRYQFYHAFALLAVAILYEKYQGSLYILTALKATSTVGVSKIGILTPFGGLFFIAGWILMVIAFIKRGPVNE